MSGRTGFIGVLFRCCCFLQFVFSKYICEVQKIYNKNIYYTVLTVNVIYVSLSPDLRGMITEQVPLGI
jgi:hypothetical protein